MRLAPAFAMVISPKSNPVRLSLEMSSRDLAGAPKNIIDKTFLLTLLLILLIPEMVFHKSPPCARFIQLNHSGVFEGHLSDSFRAFAPTIDVPSLHF